MLIRLGYVAICNTLNTTTSHTITYTNYKKMSEEIAFNKLNKLSHQNLDNLFKILKFNLFKDIYFYRMSSHIFPLATHSLVNYDYLNKYKGNLIEIGNFIRTNNMRVDLHLDQFCVLNSINNNIVTSSIKIINFYSDLLDIMNINGKMIMHIGSNRLGKYESKKRFIKNFKLLDKNVQKKIILENDDKIFNTIDTLNLCNELSIPMVLDYHHYLCNNIEENIFEVIDQFLKTWDGTGLNPKIHFSSPKSIKEYRSHNDYINYSEFISFLNIISKFNCDIDIMLEAKKKDIALFKLIDELKCQTTIKFINNSSFLI